MRYGASFVSWKPDFLLVTPPYHDGPCFNGSQMQPVFHMRDQFLVLRTKFISVVFVKVILNRQYTISTLNWKCCHFDKILNTDNFQGSQWWKFHPNDKREIKVIGLFEDREHCVPYSPYKPCNHNNISISAIRSHLSIANSDCIPHTQWL